jgi:hypothetical protein
VEKLRPPHRHLRPALGPQSNAAVTLRARFTFRVSRESEVAANETRGAAAAQISCASMRGFDDARIRRFEDSTIRGFDDSTIRRFDD